MHGPHPMVPDLMPVLMENPTQAPPRRACPSLQAWRPTETEPLAKQHPRTRRPPTIREPAGRRWTPAPAWRNTRTAARAAVASPQAAACRSESAWAERPTPPRPNRVLHSRAGTQRHLPEVSRKALALRSSVSRTGDEKMRETGLEPARYYYHQALNLARLPIPPFPQRCEPRRSVDHGPLSHSAASPSF